MYSKDVLQFTTGSFREKGRAMPWKDLVVVNYLGRLDDRKLRWKLVKKRVEKMEWEENWHMTIFRSDACVISELLRIHLFTSAWRNSANIDVLLQLVTKSPHCSREKSLLE